MWSYYGNKANIVKAYPKPLHNSIIEPFAGSAQYSLRYFDHDITLVDKYDVIIKIWKYLQECSPNDILSIPRFKHGEKIEDFKFDCEGQKLLTSFLIGFGSTEPRKTATVKMTARPNFMNFNLKKIAASLFKIKHWKVIHGSYHEIENSNSTWFIDPPYQFGGHAYVESNKNIDFNHLSDWCKNRGGQIIVCENSKATWLPFQPISKQKTLTGYQDEVIWTNQHVSVPGKQLTL